MELVPGKNLLQFMESTGLENKGFSENTAKSIVKQIIQGMRYMIRKRNDYKR
jgi:hypothetical protein